MRVRINVYIENTNTMYLLWVKWLRVLKDAIIPL